MTSMKITEARQKFTRFPKMFEKHPEMEAVEVESHGRPVMAVLSWNFYEALLETLEIAGDAKLMKLLRKSLKEAEKGRAASWESVKAKLKL